MVVLIILAIIAYLLIGGITAAIVDDEDMEIGIIIAWPFLLFFAAIFGIITGVAFIGTKIVEIFKQLLKSFTSEN